MRAIVIGAGAIGLSSAYYLRRSGAEVTVVDPAPPGSKASSHNAGWIVPSMSAPVPAPGTFLQAMRWMLRRDSPLYVTPSFDLQFVRFMATMLRNCTTARFEAGVWTNRILAGIGERVAVQAGKGYGYDLPLQPGGPAHPLYLAEAKVAVTPLDSMVRLAGTMGFGGIDERIDTVRAVGILSSLPSYFTQWPDLSEKPRPWTGLRPMTPDGLPIIGPLPRRPDVLVATGHAMLGISLAPPTGRLVADTVSGQAPARHRASLAADRF